MCNYVIFLRVCVTVLKNLDIKIDEKSKKEFEDTAKDGYKKMPFFKKINKIGKNGGFFYEIHFYWLKIFFIIFPILFVIFLQSYLFIWIKYFGFIFISFLFSLLIISNYSFINNNDFKDYFNYEKDKKAYELVGLLIMGILYFWLFSWVWIFLYFTFKLGSLIVWGIFILYLFSLILWWLGLWVIWWVWTIWIIRGMKWEWGMSWKWGYFWASGITEILIFLFFVLSLILLVLFKWLILWLIWISPAIIWILHILKNLEKIFEFKEKHNFFVTDFPLASKEQLKKNTTKK